MALDTNLTPEIVNSFNVYIDGVKAIGTAPEITLPQITSETIDVSGAGITNAATTQVASVDAASLTAGSDNNGGVGFIIGDAGDNAVSSLKYRVTATHGAGVTAKDNLGAAYQQRRSERRKRPFDQGVPAVWHGGWVQRRKLHEHRRCKAVLL